MRRSVSVSLALSILATAFFVAGAFGASDNASGDDVDALLGFVTGDYALIGRKPGGGGTYSGTVKITRSGSTLKITRCVGGKRYAGEGFIVPVTADRIPNVMYHWLDGDGKYEGRYEIHTDIDNYARLSGPYARTAADERGWGWELLYVDGDSTGECR